MQAPSLSDTPNIAPAANIAEHDRQQDQLERGESPRAPQPSLAAAPAAPAAPAYPPARALPLRAVGCLQTAVSVTAEAERYLAGNPLSVGLLTGGTIATVATYLATGRNDTTLSWGNTALATAQNIELPIGAYSVERQISRLSDPAFDAHLLAHRSDRVPDFFPQNLGTLHLGWLDRGLKFGNNLLRPFARMSGQIAGSPLVLLGAQAGIGALWLGYGLSTPCCDTLIPAVNAIPQYFTTPWVSLVLNRAKDINDRVKALQAELHANHQRLVGAGVADPLPAAAAPRNPNIIDRFAGQARNVFGAPINYTANLIVSGGMAIKAGIQGLGSEFNGDANATLATLQFPDFMVLKNVTSETKRIAQHLLNEFAPQPAKTGLWANAHRATDMVSDLFGTSYAFTASMAMLAGLGISSVGLSNSTWLTIFNGIPQCITTPVFDMAIYDINRTEKSLKRLTGILAQQQQALAAHGL